MALYSKNEKLSLLDWNRPWHAGLPMLEDGIDQADMWFFVYETVAPHVAEAPGTVIFTTTFNINQVEPTMTFNINQVEPGSTFNIRHTAYTFTANL